MSWVKYQEDKQEAQSEKNISKNHFRTSHTRKDTDRTLPRMHSLAKHSEDKSLSGTNRRSISNK